MGSINFDLNHFQITLNKGAKMSKNKITRRKFIKTGAAGLAATTLCPTILRSTDAFGLASSNDLSMFCYQCEQTAKGTGCTKIGVCGKKPDVSALQDLLVYSLKGLSSYAVAGRKVGVDNIEANKRLLSYKTSTKMSLLAYSGFSEACPYLNELSGGDVETVEVNGVEKKKPSLLKRKLSNWYCSMEDEQQVYLQATESTMIAAMDVGYLMLLVREQKDESIKEIIPVRIARMERGQSGSVHFIAEKLGSDAINVAVGVGGKELSALLVVSGGKRLLLVDTSIDFFSGQVLQIKLPDGSLSSISIDELKSISQCMQALVLA